MVLKRQLPSRVSPDAPGQAAPAPQSKIDEQWPAPAEPAPPPVAADVPPLPPLPAAFDTPLPAVETPVPEAKSAVAVPAQPADTTPSLPADNMPRRRPKTPRAFTEKAPEAAIVPATVAPVADSVAKPIAEAPDRLADAGLIASPKADPLAAGRPPALAETAADMPASIFEPSPVAPLVPQVASPDEEPAVEVAAAAPVPAAPLVQPASDLPWANEAQAESKTKSQADDGGWDIDAPASGAEVTKTPATPSAPPPDVFGDISVSRAPEQAMPSMPWSSGGAGGGHPPPELPKSSFGGNTPRGGSFQLVLAAAAVAGVLFVAYTLVTRTDSTQERLARLTGSLREAPEVVPGSAASSNPSVQPSLQPEQVVAMNNLSPTLLPPPAVANNTFRPLETSSPSTVVDFSDVPPSEAGKPIVADGTEKMPADVGFIASLQQAIAKEKSKDGKPAAIQQAETTKADDQNLTQEQKLQRGADLKAQLDEELAAYRRALADAPAPALAPKPTEFFSGKGDAKTADVSGTLLPPPGTGQAAIQARGNVEGLPPAELYAHNPKNLPILPEPAAEEVKIRQLTDFDVNVFEPDEPKVRMPKGVKPQIAAGDFPALDILSLVPGKGLIAYYEGREGVLMVGQQVAGWKLVSVGPTSAEFASGQRRQRVRAD